MQTIAVLAGLLLVISLLAFITERLVEALFAWPLCELLKLPRQVLMYVGMLVGMGLAWVFRVDLMLGQFELVARPGWEVVGQLLTGLLIGGGSNLVHDVFDRFVWNPQVQDPAAARAGKRPSDCCGAG